MMLIAAVRPKRLVVQAWTDLNIHSLVAEICFDGRSSGSKSVHDSAIEKVRFGLAVQDLDNLFCRQLPGRVCT
jgi:hypothetical protein